MELVLFVFILLFSLLVAKLNMVGMFLTFYADKQIEGVNVLVFGIDETNYVQRSDSIVVVHLDTKKEYIGALSIPRDTRVSLAGHGKSRINHAYAYGGVDLLKETVSNFLALPIDYFVKVELSQVASLVDKLGGVELMVEKPMKYTDYAGGLHIDIDEGLQVLSGDEALNICVLDKIMKEILVE